MVISKTGEDRAGTSALLIFQVAYNLVRSAFQRNNAEEGWPVSAFFPAL
jgi:hypothetical protein